MIFQWHEWSLKQMISAIKSSSPKKKLSVNNLAQKIKVHFCFQKRDGGDMDTEEIALLYFRSFCHRPDDYFKKTRRSISV